MLEGTTDSEVDAPPLGGLSVKRPSVLDGAPDDPVPALPSVLVLALDGELDALLGVLLAAPPVLDEAVGPVFPVPPELDALLTAALSLQSGFFVNAS